MRVGDSVVHRVPASSDCIIFQSPEAKKSMRGKQTKGSFVIVSSVCDSDKYAAATLL